MKFSELEKMNAVDTSEYPKVKLAVLGDCATQHICTAVRGMGIYEKLNIEITEADYNQIELQLFDPDSEVYEAVPEYVLLMLCQEKLYEAFCETESSERTSFAQNQLDKIKNYHDSINRVIAGRGGSVRILQSTFSEVDDAVLGSYGAKTEASYIYQVRKLNLMLMEYASGNGNVFLVDVASLEAKYGYEKLHDNRTYFVGKLPIATKYLPDLAKCVVDIIKSARGTIHKCVVLDLDNTLWGGVIGDDGIENIEIGELGQGQAFTRLQRWFLELKKRGIILCVCSKNEEEAAKLPFEKHPEMILKLDDIAVFVANWEDKASNIRSIQEILNIGMDSMVFIDDNPFERGVVKELIPDICVPDLPEDPSEYLPYLQSLNLFETASFSGEDAGRTAQYQAEASRVSQQKKFENYEDYLASLEMVAEVSSFDAFHMPRIAQLTQRSNQFNLRTVRYTEEEVRAIAEDESHITMYFTLRDKYGDHGLISVVILDKKPEDNSLFISEFLMSCRVLKRGMEEFIVDSIVSCAKENGFAKVVGEYVPTPKNKMVEKLYANMGLTDMQGGFFATNVDEYKMHRTYISKKES